MTGPIYSNYGWMDVNTQNIHTSIHPHLQAVFPPPFLYHFSLFAKMWRISSWLTSGPSQNFRTKTFMLIG